MTPRPPAVALTAGAWAIGLVTTALITRAPYLVFGYHSPALHLVLDSIDACVALLLAYLVHGRYLRRRRLRDLLLATGLLLLAAAGFTLTLLIEPLAGRIGTTDIWLLMTLRVAGALLVAAAALVGDRPAPVRWSWQAQALPWAVPLVLLTLSALGDRLPQALSQTGPSSPARPDITGHPLLVGAQALTAVCFLVASVLFTLQGDRRHDELLRWLGPACALAGFARVNYALFPSLYSGWLYTGDVLRTASYLVLLVGAAREINRYWSAQTRAAVLEDRRRVARELHDGVVQELSYIRSEAHTLPPGDGVPERIITACDTALDEARAAIRALDRQTHEPLGIAVHRAVQQVAERYDGHVVVALDDSVDVGQEQRHALVRIAREAASNALRHGGASSVELVLARDADGCRLVVRDDGRGFDTDAVRGRGGYGLVSMRERAAALPGSFELDSAPGRGTTVTVTW